jgi:N-acetylmuramoyl-L-alanine amidase
MNKQYLKLSRRFGFKNRFLRYRRGVYPEISDSVAKNWTICEEDRQKIKHCLTALAAAFLILVCGATAAVPKKLGIPKSIVVLDPGHGGNDIGAQSADGILEKTVTLNMAHMIANKLGDDYQVVLTRTDDYWLDIASRTAVANNLQADLFVSLHAGGSFLHSVGGTSVFYFETQSAAGFNIKKTALDPLTDPDSPIPWNHIQDKYLSSSKKLAEIIQSKLFTITQDPDRNIQGASLVVLKGADMPAILIELGYVTNPNESKALVDENFITLMADAIIKGIEIFLSKKGK